MQGYTPTLVHMPPYAFDRQALTKRNFDYIIVGAGASGGLVGSSTVDGLPSQGTRHGHLAQRKYRAVG